MSGSEVGIAMLGVMSGGIESGDVRGREVSCCLLMGSVLVRLRTSDGVCDLVGARRRLGFRGGGSGRWWGRRRWMPLLSG